MAVLGLVLAALLAVAISRVWGVLWYLTWRPYAFSKRMREQGVQGPQYFFFKGSMDEIRSRRKATEGLVLDVHNHDYPAMIMPHYLHWKSQYGVPFLYWFGPKPRICITDPDMCKQVLSNKFGFHMKNDAHPTIQALMGKGLILVEGTEWARHRRVVNPAFAMDKIKAMTRTMAECALSMIDGWRSQGLKDGSGEMEIELDQQFKELTANVISHTAFGSSYREGKEVFLAQNELTMLALSSMLSVQIPGFKYLPTGKNLYRWKLERKVRSTLEQVIRARHQSKDSGYGDDLLGLMLEACASGGGGNGEDTRLNMDEIIDECKTFFFTGHETTSHLLTWTMFLLATNQDWQDRLRAEVQRECGNDVPSADMVGKLKLVNMVLLETLRLYCPIDTIHRKATRDMELGRLIIPKGTALMIPLTMIHRDKELWGEDVDKFNPLRFENGAVKAAKHPNALVAFSMGPRACIGQSFAMLEAKTVLAMILQRFSFSISPNYVHAPTQLLSLQPRNGLPVVFRSLGV